MTDRDKIELIRNFLRDQHGRFISVTFRKKDGTLRKMNIQPATIAHRIVPETEQNASAKAAAITRAANHPNLVAAWDVRNARAVADDSRKRGVKIDPAVQRAASARSFNVYTLELIRANGKEYHVAELFGG